MCSSHWLCWFLVRFFGLRLLVLLLLAATVGAAPAQAKGRKYALLIGVCELAPPSLKGRWLYGTRNDVPRFRALLTDKYAFAPGDIQTLTGLDATRKNILNAVQTLAERADSDDLILLYFTGHGMLVPPRPGVDDPKFRYKAFVPCDVQTARRPNPKTGVVHDEVVPDTTVRNREVMERLDKSKTRNVVLLLDSCHSGIEARKGGQQKTLKDLEPIHTETPVTRDTAATPQVADDGSVGPVVLTACRADQTALVWPLLNEASAVQSETPTEAELATQRKNEMSVLTYYLIETLRKPGAEKLTWNGVLQAVRLRIDERQADFDNGQEPQAQGPLDRAVFAVASSPAPPVPNPPSPSPIVSGDAVIVQAASPGTDTLRVRPLAGISLPSDTLLAGSGDVLVQITGSSTDDTELSARRLRGAPKIGDVLSVAAFPLPSLQLRVAVIGSDAAALDSLRSRLAALPWVRVVPATAGADSPRDATVQIEVGDNWRVYRGGVALPTLTDADGEVRWAQLQNLLGGLQAMQRLCRLDNPAARLRVDVRANTRKTLPLMMGDTLELSAQNTGAIAGYLTLLDIDPAGKVTVLYPNKFVSAARLEPGQTLVLPAPALYRLRVRGPAGPEILKALFTQTPLTLPTLGSASENGLSALPGEARSLIDRLIADLPSALFRADGARGIEIEAVADKNNPPLPADGWATDTVYLQIRDGAPKSR